MNVTEYSEKITGLLDINKFEEWARLKNSGGVIGYSLSKSNCPLAKYLRDHQISCSVTRHAISAFLIRPGMMDCVELSTPRWAAKFIRYVDKIRNYGPNRGVPIHRAEVLHILGLVREELSMEKEESSKLKTELIAA